MIQKQLKNFSLRQIADSGQCFRMVPVSGEEDTYTVISRGHMIKLNQSGDRITFFCGEDEFPFWEHYFDLETDYAAFCRAPGAGDPYLCRAVSFGQGIRILRQDPWEMIITFIISQQKTIPNIHRLVEALCARYGTQISGDLYAFPSPRELARASLEELQGLKLGYRAKYIRRICESPPDLCLLETLSYREAMEYLTSFYGIGEKVANCICLFGLHHIDAFPVDTWIRKLLLREYAPKSHLPENLPQSRLTDALIEEYFSCYHGFAGVMQQYIFYYERFGDKDISSPLR